MLALERLVSASMIRIVFSSLTTRKYAFICRRRLLPCEAGWNSWSRRTERVAHLAFVLLIGARSESISPQEIYEFVAGCPMFRILKRGAFRPASRVFQCPRIASASMCWGTCVSRSFSCYQPRRLFGTARLRNAFVRALDEVGDRFAFALVGFVRHAGAPAPMSCNFWENLDYQQITTGIGGERVV